MASGGLFRYHDDGGDDDDNDDGVDQCTRACTETSWIPGGLHDKQQSWCSVGERKAGKEGGSGVGGRDAGGERSQVGGKWHRRGREGKGSGGMEGRSKGN